MSGKDKNANATRVAHNDFVEVLAHRPRDFTSIYPVVASDHFLKRADARATFAMQCIERWAMVAAQPDGEDSAGRAKLRRLTAIEIVNHACECTAAAFAQFEERG